jgi:hypothetical protein
MRVPATSTSRSLAILDFIWQPESIVSNYPVELRFARHHCFFSPAEQVADR